MQDQNKPNFIYSLFVLILLSIIGLFSLVTFRSPQQFLSKPLFLLISLFLLILLFSLILFFLRFRKKSQMVVQLNPKMQYRNGLRGSFFVSFAIVGLLGLKIYSSLFPTTVALYLVIVFLLWKTIIFKGRSRKKPKGAKITA